MKSSHVKLLAISVISCLGIIVYSNTFLCSFHFDDKSSIVDNFAIRNVHDLQNIWDFLPRRFILYLSLALNYHFNGLHVPGYHLFNLAVHLLTAIFVWWLTLLTFSTPAMKDTFEGKAGEKIPNAVALFAGLVFVAHPAATQAVTYIVQRAASMATMFYLLSLCFYVRSRLAPGKLYYIGSLIMAILAMFTKETAITLPLMILLYEFSFLKTKKSFNWGHLAPFLFTLFIIPITMLLTETGAARVQQLRSEPGISSIHYLLTQFRVMVTYIRLVFLPFHQNLDYDYPIFKNIFELPVLSSFLFLLMILFCAKQLFARYRLVSFSIFWFFLTLLPESSFLPIKDVIFEHRLYLPLVGYSMFLVSGIYYVTAAFCRSSRQALRVTIGALMVIIACYSVMTYQRNKVWRDDFTLWNDTAGKSPHKARPYNDRGLAYYQRGDFDRAMSDYNKAIDIDPGYAKAYYNRGLSYARQGDFIQAIPDFDKAIDIDPRYVEAYSNRGNLYYGQGKLAQAMSDYSKAIDIDPYSTNAYYNLGLAYAKQGSFTQAISDFTQAIAINPDDADSYYKRGLSYAIQGQFMQAVSDFTKVITLKPGYADPYYNRGLSYARQENFIQAVFDYDKDLEINPQDAQAYNNRAIIYYKLKKYDEALSDVHKAEELGVKVDPGLIRALKQGDK